MRNEAPDSRLAEQGGADYRNAGLTPRQVAMLEFAECLTIDPGNMTADHVESLRDAGWADEDVVDIVHITALYNYMVRIADGLGVEIDADWAPMVDKLAFREQSTPKTVGKIVVGPAG